MPAAAAKYDPADREWWKVVNDAGDTERKDRIAALAKFWQYFEGDLPEQLKTKDGQPNHNVLLDITGKAVEQMVAFLGVPMLGVVGGTVREPDASGMLQNIKTPEQEALDTWWSDQNLWQFVTDLLISGMVDGHWFAKLIPTGVGQMPDVALLDADMMTVYWAQGSRRSLWYRMKWTDGKETRMQDIVPNSLIDPASTTPGWQIIEYLQRNNSGEFDELSRDEWAFPFAPIIDRQNRPLPKKYYGRSEINGRLNDNVNLVASNIAKILWHHAGPQTIVTGGTVDEEQPTGPGTAISFADKDVKVYNLEMSSDLQSSLQFFGVLRGAAHSQQRVVDLDSIKDKIGQMTNFGARLLYTSQLDRAGQIQELYGTSGLAEISRRALIVGGMQVDRVESKWSPGLPVDRAELTKSVKDESELGIVSQQTLLEELGHDPVVEAEHRAEEQTTAQDTQIAALARLGQGGFI